MKIESIQKQILKKLYVFDDKENSFPMYLETGFDIENTDKTELNEKLAQTRNIRNIKMNEFKQDEITWYKLDGEEIPLTDKNIMLRSVIEKLVIKILRTSTQIHLKKFLFSLLKQLTREKDWSLKQKFLAVCKAYGVSDFVMKKKKISEIGFEDLGIIKIKATQDVIDVKGVYNIYGQIGSVAIKKGTKLFAWKKAPKYWIVNDIEGNLAFKIREDLMNDYFKLEEITQGGAIQFAKVESVLKTYNKKEKQNVDNRSTK